MTHRLAVDPIVCTGHGLCAELFPERIGLDEWGYPLFDDGGTAVRIDPTELAHARAAVNACPALALRLQRD